MLRRAARLANCRAFHHPLSTVHTKSSPPTPHLHTLLKLAAPLSQAHSFSPPPFFFFLLQQRALHGSTRVLDVAEGEYAGGVRIPFVSNLDVEDPSTLPRIAAYRVLDEDGSIRSGCEEVVDAWSDKDLLHVYTLMRRLQTMDQVLNDAQRQGRISFYMTCGGEEGVTLGSASALQADDPVFTQYREQGVFLWRGFTLQDFADQCFSNVGDPNKARQMPVHYGSSKLSMMTVSSPLATQIPQAAGSGYACKQEGKGRVAVCYFGEGAASEGDFHAGLNFAATLEAPVIFFARNNGYAISTPTVDQFAGDGIAPRGRGYGMHTIRVDGGDFFAVHEATKEARRIAATESKPVLIESMAYREGHHSTSDDSTRYRDAKEIEHFRSLAPTKRFRALLESKGLWDDSKEEALAKKERKAVLKAMSTAEKKDKPGVETLFDDVYDSKPWHLQEQEQELTEHLKKFGDHYNSSH